LNKDKTTRLLQKYDALIDESIPGGVEAKDHSGAIAMFGFQSETPQLLEHGRWMCKKAQEFDNLVRANRWLGFIQCILLVYRVRGLGGMRDDTRPVREDDVKPETEVEADVETQPAAPETQPAAPETQPAEPEEEAKEEGEEEVKEDEVKEVVEAEVVDEEAESEVVDED